MDRPPPTTPATTASMRSNRRADTAPERRVRSLLHRRGYRFRKDARISVADGSVRADIVFPRARLAVFIDGCFWHCCPEHGTRPKAHDDYWGPKLDRNMERDRLTSARLRDAGWAVLRLWEHVPPNEAASQIIGALQDQMRRGRAPGGRSAGHL